MENQNPGGFNPNDITGDKIPSLLGNDAKPTPPSQNPDKSNSTTDSQAGQYIGQIENIVQPESNKKKGWIIAIIVGVVIFAIVVIAGMYSSNILERLRGTQNESYDKAVTAKMEALMIEALLYANGNKGSFTSFSPAKTNQEVVIKCSGEPIINISKDGRFIVIFSKSCLQPDKYYCIDDRASKYLKEKTDIPELVQVDASVATSGATGCPSTPK